MAKLLTHHDKFHVHAILGLTALIHFFYRFAYLFVSLRESFTPGMFSAVSLGVHVLLHVTSFQFSLPRNRQWSKPMLWNEFRAHNAIFAYRHLIGAAMGTWFPVFWVMRPGLVSLALKVCLVWAACRFADWVTENFGSDEKRTTNAMPYPDKVQQNLEQTAKWFYAKSQFAATSLAVFGTPTLSFCSILAIEIASFLMTLVRKGIVESRTYHIVYASALFIMMPAMVATMLGGDYEVGLATMRVAVATFISVEMRMNYRFSKYLTWIAAIAGGFVLTEVCTQFIDVRWLFLPGGTWSAVDTLVTFFKARQNDRLYANTEKAPEDKSMKRQNEEEMLGDKKEE